MRVLLAAALLGAPLLAGCDSTEAVAPSGPESFTVDFTTQFDNTSVQLELDGILVYEERVTTNDVLGLAERIELSISEDPHRLRVQVSGRSSTTAEFTAGEVV